MKFNTLGSQQISIALNDNILFDGADKRFLAIAIKEFEVMKEKME